jgi:hypothetical protein
MAARKCTVYMKDDTVILEAEVVEKTASPDTLGGAFARANLMQTSPAGAPADFNLENRGARFPEFLKPTLSNLFLLGCLLGLFVLYCCSCVIHALTFPARRKSS